MITRTNVFREIRRRRASGDWFNRKQVFCGRRVPMCPDIHGEKPAKTGSKRSNCAARLRHEKEDYCLLVPKYPERHGEESLAETDWTRSKCSAEGKRWRTSDYYSQCIPRCTEKSQHRLVQTKQLSRVRHETEDLWLLESLSYRE